MILGSMQPYFFPYIGYFDLIYRSDCWLVYDTAQYIRRGWVNRNRILHPERGWQYITVPIQKCHQTTKINEVYIADDAQWRDRLLGQLQHYKRKAPFFEVTINLVAACLTAAGESLSRLNVESLRETCAYLGIPFSAVLESELTPVCGKTPNDCALYRAQELGASEYINPAGGAHLYDPVAFDEAGVKLTIQDAVDFVYECDGYKFEPRLSIIDVMMWNSAGTIRDYLASKPSG